MWEGVGIFCSTEIAVVLSRSGVNFIFLSISYLNKKVDKLGKENLSTKDAGRTMAPKQTKQNKKPIEPYLITYTKVHLKWFVDLNVKAKGHKKHEQ